MGCLLVHTAAATAQPAPAPESHRWGINNDHQATGLPPGDEGLPEGDVLLRARAAGIGWVRYVLFWHIVNPAQGVYDWHWSDVEIARLRAAGFNVMIHVAYPPTWTTGATYGNEFAAFYCLDERQPDGVRADDDKNCKNPERRPGFGLPPAQRSEHFREFVRTVVQRYGSATRAWSFGKEVHSKVYWKGDIPQLMDEVLRPGYEEVKRIDASLLVAGPDEDVEDAMEAVLKLEADDMRAGKSRVFDVLAFHAFDHSGWRDPAQMETDWRPAHCMFEASLSERSCSMKGVVDRYANGRPVWLTEFGYRAGATADANAGRWLASWIEGIKARPWIDKAFFYRLRQDPDGRGFGLFAEEPAAAPSPAAAAVATALASQPVPLSSYLAEGSTAGLFDLDVLVANPTSQPAPVKLTFLSDGGKVDTLTDTLPPTSRRTYGIGRTHMPTLSSAGGVSTIVESTQGVPLVVERTMFWNKGQRYGGHGGTAVAQPEKRWYFAEGSQGFFDTFVLLANSGSTPANVTVTFLLDEAGAAPLTLTVPVASNKRETIWALTEFDGRLEGKSFSIVVDSDVPIIAERAMYFGQRFVWPGGHGSAGVPALSPTWFHAEGATGGFFDEYILVGNPNEEPAELTFTFLLGDGGPPIVGTAQAAKQSRFTLNVEAADLSLEGISGGDAARLRDAAVSVRVEATQPVVSERAMYWPGGFSTWAEAHNSFGVTETGLKWGLAEGRGGGLFAFDTYILIANPSAQDAPVLVTFLLPNGATTSLQRTVPANSRFNIHPHEMPAGEFGVVIDSLENVPIVVERAMYWTPPGRQRWEGGTNATAVRLR